MHSDEIDLVQGPADIAPLALSQDTVYVHFAPRSGVLRSCRNLVPLLETLSSADGLSLSETAVSFFLQNGTVPNPFTMFDNVHAIGLGFRLTLCKGAGGNHISISDNFPFLNALRGDRPSFDRESEDDLLALLRDATQTRIRPGADTVLFLSAGKDSSTLALALSQGLSPGRIECVTYKAKGESDESGIASEIAAKLGFPHHTIDMPDVLSPSQKGEIETYFAAQPMPLSDNAALFYPLCKAQLGLSGAETVLDGMGNDVFLGHVPGPREFRIQRLRSHLPLSPMLERVLPSGSSLRKAVRSRPELTGLSGFTFRDEKRIRPGAKLVSPFWSDQDQGEDYIDLRAQIRGRFIDQFVFMEKIRGLRHAYGCNVVFPWTDPTVARFAFGFRENAMFDRARLRNKVFLRALLKDRLGLDSDAIGKKQFEFNGWSIVCNNWEWVRSTILDCSIWERSVIERFVALLWQKARAEDKFSKALIYRLFVFSLWYNHSRFLKARVQHA